MPIPEFRPLLPIALTTAALFAGAAFLMAAPATPRPAAMSPQQVADTLDGIVQPRFQQNAGRFGVDRIVVGGHENIYGLTSTTAAERRKFRAVNAAHRPYVIAFLHCAHKPGQDLVTHTRGEATLFPPSLQTLSAATATEAGTQKLIGWSEDNLKKVVLPDLTDLRRGDKVDKDFGNWRVSMRPVLASRPACLGCHAGAKKNDTLGVMVYAVDKNTVKAPVRVTQ